MQQTEPDSDVVARAERIPTTVLADLLGDAGYRYQVLDHAIQAVDHDARRAGWAYTVLGRPATVDESGPDLVKARAIDAMPTGAMAVWSGAGVHNVCLFGDLLGAGMAARGVRGAVVDGVVRDIDDLARIPFPVYTRGRTPQASTGIWRVAATQVEVSVAGALQHVTVRPGDLIVADVNGVVALPNSLAEEIVAAGEKYLEREDVIRARIDAGDSLESLVAEFGRL